MASCDSWLPVRSRPRGGCRPPRVSKNGAVAGAGQDTSPYNKIGRKVAKVSATEEATMMGLGEDATLEYSSGVDRVPTILKVAEENIATNSADRRVRGRGVAKISDGSVPTARES